MKKITLLFICFFSVLNICSEVYSGSCGDNASYTLDTETGILSITGTGAMKDYIFESVPWFAQRSYIKTVGIADGITSIGYAAFQSCSSLTSIEIPNSVKLIGGSAFSGCSGLTSLTIGNSVTTIGGYAFYGCYFEKQDFINNSSLDAENNNYWGANIVDSKENGFFIKDRVLLKYIGNESSVTIPSSVTSIGYQAFSGCSGLKSIEIPNSVTDIGSSAFSGCSGLTSIKIPNSVTSIESSAFYNCTGLTSIEVPNSVTSIGENAFSRCSSLKSVTIPESMTSIGERAFYSCSGLTSITIPNSVTSIGYYAFESCSGLTSVTIGNSVTEIGSSAFSGCESLTSISIGRGVISIGQRTFSGCFSLKDVYCYADDVPVISKNAFVDIGIAYATLYVPNFLIEEYKTTVPWNYFGNILELENYDPSPIPGYVRDDVNGDGIVNGTDIQAVINTIVNGEYDEKADVNEDGTVNGTDIQKIINYIVYGPDDDTGDDDDDDSGDDSGDDEDDVLDIDEEHIDQCLPAIMEKDPSISIFCQALKLTNMDDYLNQYIDHSYSIGLDSVTNGVPWIRFGGKDMVAYYKEKRFFKYTAFVESNDVLKKHGITTLEGLIAHAKKVYDETFPGDAGLYDDDYTNHKNPLNRWVSYHLMNRYGNYSDWAPYGEVLAQCCRTDVADAEDFWQTMLHEGMIRFCRADGQLYANRKGLKDVVYQGLKGVRVLTDDESGDINQQALNGRYFYIEDLLEYNTTVRDKVLNCRIRIDATTLSADFMNQDSRGNLGWDEYYLFAHKRGYIEGWKISPETFVGVHCDNLWWSSYLGNAVAVKGQYDVQIKLPNPPPGLYEIRLAYVASEERGVVQIYLNNKECGDPIDFRKGRWNLPIDIYDYDLDNEEDNQALDKSLRKLGYMLGPDSYGKPGMTSFRVDAPEHMRRIITTAKFTEGKDCWLRFRQVLEGDAEWSFDYLELCPVSIINEEDRH